MIYKPEYIFWSKILSVLIAPYYKFFNLFRKKYDLQSVKVKTILITEYHRIGDVIIIAPVLKSIKARFPDAEIILICNKEARELAKKLKLADIIFGISIPWTDWSWSLLKWYKTRSFAKNLQSLNIDIGIDFKGDIRNAWFLWSTCPKISLGYDTTGGKFFFTNTNLMNQKLHQYSRAAELVEKLGCQLYKEEKSRYHSIKNGCIVLHPGASDIARSWPDKNWIELVHLLIPTFKVSVVITTQSSIIVENLKKENLTVQYFEGSLVRFSDYINNQKCVIAVDSMAGHLASYLGIPVISLFGSQDPILTKPKNKFGKIIKPEKLCRHNLEHWRFCRLCIESISPKTVYETVLKHVSHIECLL